MNSDNIETALNKPKELLAELQRLLEAQVTLARQGKIDDVETLSTRIKGLVGQMSQRRIFELDEFKEHRGELAKLYKQLILTFAAQKDNISRQLQRVGAGKKMLGAYRANV